MGVETGNYEIAAEGFENNRLWFAFFVVGRHREILPLGYLKGRYKSDSSLMTYEAELQCCCSITRIASSILSPISMMNLELELFCFLMDHRRRPSPFSTFRYTILSTRMKLHNLVNKMKSFQ